jgi:hypothetical protein
MKRDSVFQSVQKIKSKRDVSSEYQADALIEGRLRSHFTETAVRARTCHVCRETIPKGDSHVGLYSRCATGWVKRQNLCMFCVDTLGKVLKQKVPWRKRLKKRLLDRLVDSL